MPQAVTERLREKQIADRSLRRSKLRHSILFVAITAIALLLFLVWRRDRHYVQQPLAELDRYRSALQAQYDRLGQLPARLPRVPNTTSRRATYLYIDDATRYYQQKTTEPVIVLSTRSINQILGTDGRAVVIAEGKQLRVEWITEAEFLKREMAQSAAMKKALSPPRPRPAP